MKNVSSEFDNGQVVGFTNQKGIFYIGKIQEVHIRKTKTGEIVITYDIVGNAQTYTVSETDVKEFAEVPTPTVTISAPTQKFTEDEIPF